MNVSTAAVSTAAFSTVTSNFHALDYTLFGLLLLLSVSIGIYFGFFDGTEQTTDEYLLGGRRMRPIPVAISLVASQLSAYSIISVPAETYSYGSTYTIMVLPVVILMTLLVNYAVFPVFFQNNVDNCYEYLERRFGSSVRKLTTFIFLLSVLLFLPISSFLPAFAFAQITGLNLHMINAIVSAVCIAYTVMGGVKAVIWTDVVQATVMVFSICMVFVCAVMRVGGLHETLARAIDGERLTVPSFVLDLNTRQTVWNMSAGLLCMWMQHVAFNQSCVQRLSSLSSLKDARKTMVIFCCGVVLVKALGGAIGVAMYAYYKNCDPVLAGVVSKADKMMPLFVNEIVGHISGMPGIFISCVFSASLSTVSAYLNSVSGIIYKDYICRMKSFQHTERKASIIMRLIICALGLYCICVGYLVEKSSSLFQVQFTVTSLSCGVVVGVFSLGLFYPWASGRATFCGAITSMIVMAMLITSAQINPHVHKPLPTSNDGCVNPNIADILQSSTTSSLISPGPISDTPLPTTPPKNSFSIYEISFQWYPLIGTCIVWLVAILMSHTIARIKEDVDASLLSPLVRPFLSKRKQLHTEMLAVNLAQTEIALDGKTSVTETIYAVPKI